MYITLKWNNDDWSSSPSDVNPKCVCVISLHSKTALLEGLEVDQYMWGILNAIQKWVNIEKYSKKTAEQQILVKYSNGCQTLSFASHLSLLKPTSV